MARVYKAYHTRLHRDEALKIILLHIASQAEFRAMFEHEARVVANLDHPNIVKVYGFGEERNYTYLAMQYLNGGTLRDYLRSGYALELSRVIRYTIQMARALHHAHLHDIVHCDVKPQNMLISGSTGEELLLSDFGIARLLDASRREAILNLTHEGIPNSPPVANRQIEGTAEYMAPEQIRQQMVDARTDIYSLGVVLYSMLAGRLPFSALHDRGLMYQHLEMRPPAIRSINPAIPEALARIAERALEKNPEARFQSAEQMARALEEVIAFFTFPTENPQPFGPFGSPGTGLAIPPSQQPALSKQSDTCPSCHNLVEPTNTFCYRCGHYLRTVEESTIASSISEKDVSPKHPTAPSNSMVFTIRDEVSVFPQDAIINIPTVGIPAVPSQERAEQESLPAKICPSCQVRLWPDCIFCVNCGRRIAPSNSSSHPERKQQNKPRPAQADQAEDRNSPLIGSLLAPMSSLLAPSISAPSAPPVSQHDVLVDQLPGSSDDEKSAEGNKTPAQTQITQLLEEGNAHFLEQRYEEALVAYQRVLDIDARNAIAYANKGKTLLELERYEEALRAYVSAIHLSPYEAELWTAKAYLHSKLEQCNEVLESCERALRLNGQDGLTYSYKGKALMELGRYEEALAAYEMVLTYVPNDTSAWVAKGYILYRQREHKKALSAYEQAARQEPDNVSILFNKGKVLARLKNYTGALEAYDQATRLKPDEITIWQAKGEMHIKHRQYEQALDAYNRVLALTPQDGAIWGIKGNVLFALERYEEALDACEQALKLLPRRGSIWAAKGKALEKLERYEEALTAFECARLLKPDDIAIRDHYDLLRVLKKHPREEREPRTGVAEQDEYHPPLKSQPTQQSAPLVQQSVAEEHFDVFLSYSDEQREDAVWVENLATRLYQEHGFNVWLDKWVMIPGRPWQQERARGLEQANCCAVCIGERTSHSWSQQEVQMALARQQKDDDFRVFAIILPNASGVHIEEYDFLKLNTLVDFRKEDSDWAFHVVVCGVQGIAPGKGLGKEQSTLSQTMNIKIELKLRELRILRDKHLVDDTVALDIQRTVLEKYYLD